MNKENLKPFTFSIVSFLLGIIVLIIGFNGENIAISFSRPNNATTWETSGTMIDTFTYIPIVIGISLILLSIITFSLTFYKRLKN